VDLKRKLITFAAHRRYSTIHINSK